MRVSHINLAADSIAPLPLEGRGWGRGWANDSEFAAHPHPAAATLLSRGRGAGIALRFRLAALSVLALAIPAAAAPALHSAAKASAPSGLTAIALVTTDRDWLKKWNTPTPGVAVNGTDTLHAGDHATLIVSFSNARSRNGRATLRCDVAIRHTPAGSGQDQSLPPTICYDGPAPPPNLIALTELQIEISADPGDKPGLIRFDIGVTDVNGGGRVPLSLLIRDDPQGHGK